MHIYTGVDLLLTDLPATLAARAHRLGDQQRGDHIGLRRLGPAADAYRGALRGAGVNLVRLFGPGHGLAAAIDGAAVPAA
ncbi:MAG: hypothetical protein R2838_20090 [Caldilineaceae bacterium]